MKQTKRGREFVVAVGANVKRERERRRWSQAALGSKLGGAHSVVSRVESGERDIRLSELYEVARALETTPASLVSVEGK